MPWCEPCDRFYNPNTLLVDGSCPRCSTVLPAAGSGEHDHAAVDSGLPDAAASKIPWHFWLVLVLVALYLGWRVIDFGIWLVRQIF